MTTWNEVTPGLWRSTYVTPTNIPASTFALRLRDGDIAVVSPCVAPDDAFLAATEALGKVTALVAPNSGHDLGQAAWQARYPDATCFAPAPAAAAIKKAKPKLRAFEPLEALAERAADGVRVAALPGVSAGFSLITVEADGKSAILVDEAISNSPTLIGPAPFRLVFWLTGSGPGLSRNKVWWWLFAKDKPGIARAILAEMDRAKPTVLLPLHGDPITGDGIAGARALLEPLAR